MQLPDFYLNTRIFDFLCHLLNCVAFEYPQSSTVLMQASITILP